MDTNYNLKNDSNDSSNKPALSTVISTYKHSIDFFKKNFKVCFKIQLTSILLAIIAGALTAGFIFLSKGLIENWHIFQNKTLSIVLVAILLIIIGLAAISTYLFVIVVFISAYRALFELVNGQFTTFKDTLTRTIKSLHSIIWIGILMQLANRGAMFLLVIPALILFVLTRFAVFEFFTDPKNKKGMKSLISSWNLVRSYWWPVLWRMISVVALSFGAILLSAIIFVLVRFASGASMSDIFVFTNIWSMLPVIIIGTISTLFFVFVLGPIVICFETRIYNELKKFNSDKNKNNTDATINNVHPDNGDKNAAQLNAGSSTNSAELKKYKSRFAMLLFVIILGLFSGIFSSIISLTVGSMVSNNKYEKVVDCNQGVVADYCKKFVSLDDMRSLAEKSNLTFEKYLGINGVPNMKIGLPAGWESEKTTSRIVHGVSIWPKDNDSEVYFQVFVIKGNDDDKGMDDKQAKISFSGWHIGRQTPRGPEDVIYKLTDKIFVTYSDLLDESLDKMSIKTPRKLHSETWVSKIGQDIYFVEMSSLKDSWNEVKKDMYKLVLVTQENI